MTDLSEMMRDLFTDLSFNTADGMIREHQDIAIMVDTLQGREEDLVDVVITVLPFEISSSELEGTVVSLTPIGAKCADRIEATLDIRGQVKFADLPNGKYIVSI